MNSSLLITCVVLLTHICLMICNTAQSVWAGQMVNNAASGDTNTVTGNVTSIFQAQFYCFCIPPCEYNIMLVSTFLFSHRVVMCFSLEVTYRVLNRCYNIPISLYSARLWLSDCEWEVILPLSYTFSAHRYQWSTNTPRVCIPAFLLELELMQTVSAEGLPGLVRVSIWFPSESMCVHPTHHGVNSGDLDIKDEFERQYNYTYLHTCEFPHSTA